MTILNFQPPVYRPPAEAYSLLVPVTVGCSYNGCTFCAMYRNKRYSVRNADEIVSELREYAVKLGNGVTQVRKVFLLDGDALGAPTETLLSVVGVLNELFPRLKRISVYATAKNVLEKTTKELSELSENKLNLAYLGLESGSEDVLKLVNKGNTAEEMIESAVKLRAAAWQQSAIAMLGLGGRELSENHCVETARAVSQMTPEFFSFLTTVPVPGTRYSKLIEDQELEILSTKELLEEMLLIISNIAPAQAKIIFRANHISNQYPIGGILPRDREKLVNLLENWIAECPEGVYPEANPGML